MVALSWITLFVSLVGYCAAIVVPRSPILDAPLVKRAGPSGAVITPAGGTTILNLGGNGQLHLQYQRVNTTWEGQQVYTTSIDIAVSYLGGQPIAYGVQANPPWADVIDVYFTPAGCGEVYLNVTEHQYLTGQTYSIAFQSAAPLINIECGPIQ